MMQQEPATNPLHRLIILAVVTICGTVNAITAVWALFTRPAMNTDFIGIWSFARFIRSEPISSIYAAPALQAFEQHIFPGFHSEYVFPYPPSFLMAISWLGHFGFTAAYALWTILGIAALSLSASSFLTKQHRWVGVIAILAAPASLLNGIGGETGYFTGALLLYGFAVLPSNQVAAGIAFGLLTLKPQLGLLVPFALLARGDWLALLSAILTTLTLALLSAVIFPPSLWLVWLHNLSAYQSSELTTPIALTQLMVTVTAALVNLGATAWFAGTGQSIASVTCVILTFICFKKASYRTAVAALLVGSFLTTPHAYIYDTVPLTACLLLQAEAALLSWPLILLGATLYLTPYILLTPARPWFLYAFPEAVLFMVIIRLAFATDFKESARYEPDPRPAGH